MTIKRIDIFAVVNSHYGILHLFVQQLHNALQTIGIKSRILPFNQASIETLAKDPPDCTLSFNSLYPHDFATPLLCDLMLLPHITYLTTHPHQSLLLAKSPHSIITCMDMSSWGFLRAAGCQQLLFMPPAVDPQLLVDPKLPRRYEVLFPATCIDYEELHEIWQRKYPPALCQVLDEAANILLSNQTLSIYDVFAKTLARDPSRQKEVNTGVHGVLLFNELDAYVSGKARVDLIRSIRDAKIEIVGGHLGSRGWEKYVGSQPNVTIHPGISIEQTIEMMKQSRIVLNNSPTLKHGVHERVLMGLACGALVVTDENSYLTEQFDKGKAIVMYRQNELDQVNATINSYLADSQKSIKISLEGQAIVHRSHTWEKRSKDLIKSLNFLTRTTEDPFDKFTDLYEGGKKLEALQTIITTPEVKYEELFSKKPEFQQIINYADASVFQDALSFETAVIALQTVINRNDRLKVLLQYLVETLNVACSLQRYYFKDPLKVDFNAIITIDPTMVQFMKNKVEIYTRWQTLCKNKPWLDALSSSSAAACYSQPFHPFAYPLPLQPQTLSSGDIPLIFLTPLENADYRSFLSQYSGKPVIYVCESLQILFHMLQWDDLLQALIAPQAYLYLLDCYPTDQFKEHQLNINASTSLQPILMTPQQAYTEAMPILTQALKNSLLPNPDSTTDALLYAIADQLRYRILTERYGKSRCIGLNVKRHLTHWHNPNKTLPPPNSNLGPAPIDYFGNLCSELKKQRKPHPIKKREKIRIAHVVSQLVDGGHAPTRLITNLINYRDKNQFDVRIISSESLVEYPMEYPVSSYYSEPSTMRSQETTTLFEKQEVPVYIEKPQQTYLETAHHLTALLDRENVDIAIFHGPNEIHNLCSSLTSTPIRIMFEHGTLPAYPCYDAIIASTETTLFPGQVHLLPFCVDIRKEWDQKPFSKKELGFPENSILLTTISNHLITRLNPKMCQTIATILQRCPQAIYAPMGKMDDPKPLYAIFNEYGVRDRVVFLGPKDVPGQYARSMEIYLNEFPFGSCLGMLDAMASGCPIISMHDKNGPAQARYAGTYLGLDHVITSGSVDEYIDLACRLILDKDEYKKWSEYTLKCYEQHSDEKLYVKHFEQILLSIKNGQMDNGPKWT